MLHSQPDTTPALRCFACTNEYDYLGSGHHPGVCPACGSQAVPPAGQIASLDVEQAVESNTTDDALVTVTAVDESGRDFRWFLGQSARQEQGILTVWSAEYAGEFITPQADGWGSAVLPSAVRPRICEAVGDADRLLVANCEVGDGREERR